MGPSYMKLKITAPLAKTWGERVCRTPGWHSTPAGWGQLCACTHVHTLRCGMGWLDPSPVLRILAEPTAFCLGPCTLSFAEGSEQEHRASGWVLAGFLV